MIRYISQKQLPLEGFDTSPGMILDPNNRWVKLRDCISWDELSESFYRNTTVWEEMKKKAILIHTFPKEVLQAFKQANNELLTETAGKSLLAKKVIES